MIDRNRYLTEELIRAKQLLITYSETRDAALMGDDRRDAELLAERLDMHARSWMTEIHATKTIYKHNEDKPHRCPVCHSIPSEISGRAKRWRIYTCPFGHRFSMLPLITKEYESPHKVSE